MKSTNHSTIRCPHCGGDVIPQCSTQSDFHGSVTFRQRLCPLCDYDFVDHSDEHGFGCFFWLLLLVAAWFVLPAIYIFFTHPNAGPLMFETLFGPHANQSAVNMEDEVNIDSQNLTLSTEDLQEDVASNSGGLVGAGTTFFGIASKGSRFCFIIDVSGSMQQQNRLSAALSELSSSLKKLPDFARFYVLFYSSHVKEPSSQKGWNTARSSTVRRMINEFETVYAGGGTMPEPAFAKAFSLEPLPEVIFFLTDGEISGISVDTLRTMIPQGKRIVVNTIAFGDSANQQEMIDIAKATGGQYKFVSSGGKP